MVDRVGRPYSNKRLKMRESRVCGGGREMDRRCFPTFNTTSYHSAEGCLVVLMLLGCK